MYNIKPSHLMKRPPATMFRLYLLLVLEYKHGPSQPHGAEGDRTAYLRRHCLRQDFHRRPHFCTTASYRLVDSLIAPNGGLASS